MTHKTKVRYLLGDNGGPFRLPGIASMRLLKRLLLGLLGCLLALIVIALLPAANGAAPTAAPAPMEVLESVV